MLKVEVILFEEFETLDVFGPVELFGHCPEFTLTFRSLSGGIIRNQSGVSVMTESFSQREEQPDLVLIPGGLGTRKLVDDPLFLHELAHVASHARFILTVCTGSALLAKTELLDNKKATSNKKAFDWVQALNPNVKWQRQARWTKDGSIYTSSGVSAGMDMALGFIADFYQKTVAQQVANDIEYLWNQEPTMDPFA